MAGGHNHPRHDPIAVGTPGYLGSISDYRAVAGSTCEVPHNDPTINNGNPLKWGQFDGQSSHLVDGPVPQCWAKKDVGDVRYTTTPTNRGILSFKARTGLKNITDGTTKTLLGGEVGRATAESSHAFNGDHLPAMWIGRDNPFCQRCGEPREPKPGGDDGFGGMHPSMVMFVMCDGSVQAISRDINLDVLDRMATRAGDDPYTLDEAVEPCQH
jgi:hypothetical protein